VAELERRVGHVPVPAPDVPPAQDGRLKQALEELDALRQAMAQEHAARVNAESSEELALAKAEIQRQAALLEELAARREKTR